MRWILPWGLVVALPHPAFAQETSPEIQTGSSRVGGPGITESEQRWVSRFSETGEYLTEEDIPRKGSPRRLGVLHSLAERSIGAREWTKACERFDAIREEHGTGGVTAHPRGAENAYRAYYRCARTAASTQDHEKVDRLLALSESFGPKTPKHERVRETMLRNQYRKKVEDGDLDGAIELFEKAQRMRIDEDERIWLGQQLAEAAWRAYHAHDGALDELVRRTEAIAPLNTDFRRLKDKLREKSSVFRNVVGVAVGVVVFIGLWTTLNRWRGRRLVDRAVRKQRDDF